MTWLDRMFGSGSVKRLHRPGWLPRLFRSGPEREVYEAREAREELAALLEAATKEADDIMARIGSTPKGQHHG